ncbi:MAG: hypothetical protein K6C36_03590 [Clostridia bacterium]|nr:hypothetical protein [Clostridia bacterium]
MKTMNILRRSASVIVALCMVLSLLPAAAAATVPDAYYSLSYYREGGSFFVTVNADDAAGLASGEFFISWDPDVMYLNSWNYDGTGVYMAEFNEDTGEYSYMYADSQTADSAPVGEFVFTLNDASWSGETDVSVTPDTASPFSVAGGSVTVTVEASEVLLPPDDYDIGLGDTITIDVVAGYNTYVAFVPSESGDYSFTSVSSDDTCCYLYASDRETELKYDDDSGEGANFLISYPLEAGETYWYAARYLDSGRSGSFDVTLTESVDEDPSGEQPEEPSSWSSGDDYSAILRGDIDNDGHNTAADARSILRISAGLETADNFAGSFDGYGYPSEAAAYAADSDGNGTVTPEDARYALCFALQIETEPEDAPELGEDFIYVLSNTVDGDRVYVTLTDENAAGHRSGSAQLTWDADVLELVEYEIPSHGSDFGAAVVNLETGCVAYFFRQYQENSSEDLATFEFRLVDPDWIGETIVDVNPQYYSPGYYPSYTYTYVSLYNEYDIAEGQTLTVEPGEAHAWINFTPETSGTYVLESSGADGEPWGEIYDASRDNWVDSSFSRIDDINFSIVAALEAGETYCYKIQNYNTDVETSFDVTLTYVQTEYDIEEGQTITVDSVEGVYAWVTFTPEKTGTYLLESSGASSDIGVELYDGARETWLSGTMSRVGEGDDFIVSREFEAGATYCYRIYNYDSDTTFELTLSYLQTEFTIKSGQTLDITASDEYSLYFKFKPKTGGVYIFRSVGVPDDLSVIADLYSGSDRDTWLAGSSIYNEEKGNYTFEISHYLEKGETYYYEVRGTNGTSGDCKVELAKYKPDYTIEAGQTLTVDPGENGVYIGFTPTESGFYTLESFAESGDPYCAVSDDTLDYWLSSADSGGEGENFRAGYAFEAGATYYFRVTDEAAERAGAFDVTLTKFTADYVIEPGQTISVETDPDGVYVQFTPAESGNYAFSSLTDGVYASCYLYTDPTGYYRTSAYGDYGYGETFRLVSGFDAGTTYYFKVQSNTDAETIDVTLQPFEPELTIEPGMTLELGETGERGVYIAFTPTEDDAYELVVTPDGSAGYFYGALRFYRNGLSDYQDNCYFYSDGGSLAFAGSKGEEVYLWLRADAACTVTLRTYELSGVLSEDGERIVLVPGISVYSVNLACDAVVCSAGGYLIDEYEAKYTDVSTGMYFEKEDGTVVTLVVLGDVDGDGMITASDARLTLRGAVKLDDLPEGSPEYIAADVGRDGEVAANDARTIMRHVVMLEAIEGLELPEFNPDTRYSTR